MCRKWAERTPCGVLSSVCLGGRKPGVDPVKPLTCPVCLSKTLPPGTPELYTAPLCKMGVGLVKI